MEDIGVEHTRNHSVLFQRLENKLAHTKDRNTRFLVTVAYVKVLFAHKCYDEIKEICTPLIYDPKSLSCNHFRLLLRLYFSSLKGDNRYVEIIHVLDFILNNKPDYPREYIYNELANTYYHIGQYNLAIVNFTHLLEIVKGRPDFIASLHNNIGLAYANINDKVNAKRYFEKAQVLWKAEPVKIKAKIGEVGYSQFTELIKKNIMGLDSVQNDRLTYESLKKEYQDFSMDKKFLKYRVNIDMFLSLAEHAYKLGNYEEGNQYLNLVEQRIKNGEHLSVEDQSRYMFLRLQNRIINKDTDGAIEQSYVFKKVNTALEKSKTDLYIKTSPLDNEWKTKLLTEREKALKAEKQFKLVLYLLVSVLIVFLVLIYKGYTSQKKSRTQIAEQKKQLERALRNTEMLLKEVHHRVKNNLQLVTSIAYIEYEKNGEQFDFSGFENRIISLSLIHRLLYSTEDISDISFDVYMKDLMFNLQNTSLGEFNYHLEIEPVHLPLENAITFGLLINELVTNTLKHCIPQSGEQKHISISFLKSKDQWRLHYKDNGTVFKTTESNHFNLGDSLIELLIHKLRGKHEVKFDNGYNLNIYLKQIQPA